jgi:putative oxygen-independent coproporphyrinogen III oxidase
VLAGKQEAAAGFGVYVHVPFCAKRCDYCAFSTYTDRDHLMVRYADACVAELTSSAREGSLPAATSVFFGGGTPSRLDAADLARVLAAVPRAEGAEVTVECNPEDADEERFAAWRAAGVNRVSFGIQSTAAHVLGDLGRRHRPEPLARLAGLVAGAGFSTWNLDLIFGAVSETDEDWVRTLAEAVASGAPHVSAYALTVEPGTPLAADPLRHPDDDVQARRYEHAERVLSVAGYHWEEISNWARPGHGCVHNRLYWSQGDYLGVGSAAHSHRAGRRWWNVRTPERYIEAVEAGRPPVAGTEVLTGAQRGFERLSLSLRTPLGVPSAALPPPPALDGLVERGCDRAVLTVRGRLLANAVTAHLAVDAGPPTNLPR